MAASTQRIGNYHKSKFPENFECNKNKTQNMPSLRIATSISSFIHAGLRALIRICTDLLKKAGDYAAELRKLENTPINETSQENIGEPV